MPTPGPHVLYLFPVHPIEMVAYELNDDYLYIIYMDDGELKQYGITREMFNIVYADGVGFELNAAFNLRRLP